MGYGLGETLQLTVGNVATLIVRVIVLAGMVTIYFLEGRFAAENLAHKLWIQAGMVAVGIELLLMLS